MRMSKSDVRRVIETYIKAWVDQDPDLIVTIFTDHATYNEGGITRPTIHGREGIRAYWERKVVQEQANIKCRLLSLFLDGKTVITEWEAEFDDLPAGRRKRLGEVAILTFEGAKISSLREYWNSERVDDASSPTGNDVMCNVSGNALLQPV